MLKKEKVDLFLVVNFEVKVFMFGMFDNCIICEKFNDRSFNY